MGKVGVLGRGEVGVFGMGEVGVMMGDGHG